MHEGDRGWLARPWTLDADRQRQVVAACEGRLADAWTLLGELIALDSDYDDVASLDRVVEVARRWFEPLRLAVEVERTAAGLPVLLARRVVPGAPRILLVGHLDTVFPLGTAASWPLLRDGPRATGPGVADAKGSAAALWLALMAVGEVGDGLPNLSLEVLLNTDEEAGSVESRPLIERSAREADVCLVYEPGRPDGTIVRQRRGARRYRVTVQGKAAHSGVEPWKGVNAIEAAAHKVLALQALNDPERQLSVTVAVIRGGSRVNIVPDLVTLDVDTRLPDDVIARRTHAAVEEILAGQEVPGATAGYEILSDRPPMMPQPGVESLLERFRMAASAIGMELRDSATGGGSDGCFTAALGVPTLDALGPVGGAYHTRDEFVLVDTLVERAAVSAGALLTLDQSAERH